MPTHSLYPWLHGYWQQIQSLVQQDRLPHALLLKGNHGLGLTSLAFNLVTSILCKTPTEQGIGCNQCKDCQLLAAGNHPDFHPITIADDKKQIAIEQIRALVRVCQQRPHQGGYRAAIIYPADAMNIASSNALLKTLEEPGEKTMIILVSSAPHLLPATVRSRCRLFSIYPPAEKEGLDWLMNSRNIDENSALQALRLSGHAPLAAEKLLKSGKLKRRQNFFSEVQKVVEGQLDPIKLVANVDKTDFLSCFEWLYSLVLDTKKFSHQVSSTSLANHDQQLLLHKLSMITDTKLNLWTDRIIEAKRLLNTTSNINPQLLLEDLMFRLIAIFK